jgi:phage shock protein A
MSSEGNEDDLLRELESLRAQRAIDAKAASKACIRTTGRISGPSNRGFSADLNSRLEQLDKRIAEVTAKLEACRAKKRDV